MSSGEEPAVAREGEVAEDELDDGVEAFEGADEVRAVGPGAAEVDVEGVAVFFRGEFGAWRAGDERSKLAGFAPELAIDVGVFVDGSLDIVS